jgi:hypothetical protein
MTEFKPKQSLTNTDIQERNSILCLERLLSHCDIKTHFTLNDKAANIDGIIDLLTDRIICGKITVQIKTYPKKYYGKSKYDFPTSLFGYAKKCPTEIVLLVAVDNKNNIAYWKNIDRALILKYEDKSSHGKITIHFEENEIIHMDNVDETIKRWKELYKKTSDLINQGEVNHKENEQLKIQLRTFQNPIFTIHKDHVIKLQRFIDKYNYLLDYEYNYIKLHFYSNPWKIALVVFEYGHDEISFIIHEIEFGENGLIVKEIPIDQVKDFTNYSVMYRNCRENAINDNPEKYAFKLIQEKVLEMLENKSVLFLTEDTAIEYIFDFITQEGSYLGINKEVTYNLIPLNEIILEKYPTVSESTPFSVFIGKHRLNLNIFYDCIQFLIDKGFTFIYRPYPSKGQFGKTGFVSDFYTPELAHKKIKFLYELMPSLFDAYMITAFPYLRNIISFYSGYDLILVDLTYIDEKPDNYTQNHQIVVYYLRLCEGTIKPPELIVSLNYQSSLYFENDISSYESMTEHFDSFKRLIYHDNKYEIMKSEGVDISLLFGDYFIHNMLYKYLCDRFNDYFSTQNKK